MADLGPYKSNISQLYKNIFWKYLFAFGFGMMMGFKMLPNPVVATLFLGTCGLCAFYGFKEKMDKFFVFFPFVCYTEPYMRGYVRSVPYLSLQYLLIGVFAFLIFKHIKDKKAHSNGYLLMVFYGVMEILNGFFPANAEDLRPVWGNTFALIAVITWGSFNTLSPQLIVKLLTHVKIAAIYLSGIVLVAHLQGRISYNTESNFNSSNGMAPVQLSGYLGWGSILLMLSFLNPDEKKFQPLNLVLFVLCTTVMILTFSRGGLYFLGMVMAVYFFFNRANIGSYIRLILFVPVGFLIYYIVTTQTEGTIEKRYNKKGSSNRDVLVEAGFKIFLDEPIVGVGTTNYNTEIVKRKYFDQVSTAHNEFVRAAAEHGIIGIFLYWGFFIVTFKDILLKRHGTKKQFSFYFLLLFCLILVHNGLKVSIQPLLMLLAVANPEVAASLANQLSNAFTSSNRQQRLQPS